MSNIPARNIRRWRNVVVGVAFAFALLAVAIVWIFRQKEAPPTPPIVDSDDPRVTYAGPFLNFRPDVKYVGDEACAGCHGELSHSFAKHPMGQAMAPVSLSTKIERFDGKSHDPLRVGEFLYEIKREEHNQIHKELLSDADGPIAEISEPIQFAIGSGANARSYAFSRDGYLFQSPVTWYRGGQRWDLSPSYEIRNQHFTRVITPGCLFCHSNFADHVPGTVNRYRDPIFHGFAIGCERCHGPGELHVTARGQSNLEPGTLDHTIVNPARLEHHLREAICQQCHLQGEERVVGRGRSEWDFRPGLPLHPFLMDFVDSQNSVGGDKFVNSVEQMMASRCYRESTEPKKLGCISCHDAHRHPADETAKVAHYRGRCLTCHSDNSCSLTPQDRRQKQPDDSCIACHMPKVKTEVNHAAITNHQIPRKTPKLADGPPARQPTPGPNELVAFHAKLIQSDATEYKRNLGMARMAMLNRQVPPDVAKRYAASALPPLDEAIAAHQDDWPAVEARADALWILDRTDEARAAYALAVAARPDFEHTRSGAGALALAMGRPQEARENLEKAVEINPWQPQHRHDLAIAYFRLGLWAKATGQCRKALSMEPSRIATRSLLIQTYLWDGRAEPAQAELKMLRRMTVEVKRKELESWFAAEKSRAAGAPPK